MIQKVVSVWIAIGAAASVSFLCYILAGEAGRPLQYRGEELSLLSRAFYPDSVLVYLFPLPLGIWAIAHSIRCPNDHDRGLLIVTASLSVTLVFMAIFALALAMPYIPGAPSVIR